MSYQVLARKWRPRDFSTLVGQEHIVRTLVNALEQQRLHHAYLFTGTRGVGKTTIARIIAKCLNCETGITATPCGTCSACTSIDAGRFLDLIEVDAASRTKVEDTRELLDNVQYAPSYGRYKIYLIDEVHMLSTHSFNALLKTLEEPPPHVKFLLATTDPQKLPVTILSRCLQFNLKRMPVAVICEHLQQILKAESIEAETVALQRIAQAADGSMRDAQSLLDQAIAFGNGKVLRGDVESMLGDIPRERVYDLLDALADNDAQQLMQVIQNLGETVSDFASVLIDLIASLHSVSRVQLLPELAETEQADAERLQSLANKMSKEDVQLYYQIALLGRRDLPYAQDSRGGFEMILLRMLAFRPELGSDTPAPAGKPAAKRMPQKKTLKQSLSNEFSQDKAQARTVTADKPKPTQPLAPATDKMVVSAEVMAVVEAPASEPTNLEPIKPQETKPEETNPEPIKPEQINPERINPEPTKPEPINKLPPEASTAISSQTDQNWPGIIASSGIKGLAYQLAANCQLVNIDGHIITLRLNPEHANLQSEAAVQRLTEALMPKFGDSCKLSIEIGDTEVETPAQQDQRKVEERQHQAQDSIEKDPFIVSMEERFEAKVIPDSVRINK